MSGGAYSAFDGSVWAASISGETALAKIEAGANLVQLYTGMIYRGPGIANAINRELAALLDRKDAASISDLRDGRMKEWAVKPIPA